ncbi:hypothetical protein L210DRAFT_2179161 [Boletus edulis BED1]|uniref:SET domain-containing protein n=1 Tax=Boletus edulis BED1 TaxID=1328754 RepID=A0AAD4BTP8_BOLED|nr:hypothetical protein L210DRAFT_2179161 [Boletus edulis BED1]
MDIDTFVYIDCTEPDSPTSTTLTATPFSPVSDDPSTRFSKRQNRGRDVYKEVWDEFYDWEPGYCAEILGTVTQSILASKRQVARVAKTTVARLLDDTAMQAPSVPLAQSGTDTVIMSVTHFQHPRSGHRHVHTKRMDVPIPVITTDALSPHPKYESCPPASRSVLMDDDREHILFFMPYADDERFPAQAYQDKFETLDWEIPLDPDVEMIQIETVRRLYTTDQFDIHDIDGMGMFNLKEIRVSHNTGLQWELSQRDVLHWPGSGFQVGMEKQEKQLPNHTPDAYDLRQRLTSNLKVFCPSINCLHSACETHGKMHANGYVPSRKPRMTGKGMILSEGDPCGRDCFRHIQDFDIFMETLPPSPGKFHHRGSLDTLETILGIAPDMFPCKLADICLKPCKEVFVQRLQLFPDHTILPIDDDPLTDIEVGGSSHVQPKKTKKQKFVDKSHTSCELLPACAHPGPCTSKNCECYAKKQHCSLMCKCGVKCNRQWQGCRCTNGRCLPATCECAKQMRECIPGICVKCYARPCDNTRMQHLALQPVEIKCGLAGLGAFACQTMNPNTFLGTYVGHILSNAVADQTMFLAKYTAYNYLFEVSPEEENIHLPIFDAAYIGNATRFLNHGNNGKNNVEAKSMLVIGEHQIGFFTKRKVKAGEELFLDYGDIYWKDMEWQCQT